MFKKGKKQDEKKMAEEMDEQALLLDNRAEQELRTIRHKHPDCIPVYFARHKAAPKTLKQPTQSFMLFKKDLKIEQAMYRLYEQIQTKGLYFFCLQVNKDKAKYIKINPGPTIQEMYNRYGRNDCLVLVYGNGEMGMEGLQKMEKCMLTFLVIVGAIWLVLFGYNYYLTSGYGEPAAAATNSQLDQSWSEQAN